MTDAAHPNCRPLPPRRVQVYLDEATLRTIFDLKPDESIHAVQYSAGRGALTVMFDSPRLRPVGHFIGREGQDEPDYQPLWDVDPPYVKLPLSDHYEPQDDQPYPLVLVFPDGKGGGAPVPLTREDGMLRPNADLTGLGLTDQQQAHVREVCERYSLVQS